MLYVNEKERSIIVFVFIVEILDVNVGAFFV